MLKKIKVKEVGWGICKDGNGNCYVGIKDEICQNMETGEIYRISKKNENDEVVEIEQV